MNDKRLQKRGKKNGRDVWTARLPLPRDADGGRRQHRFTFVGGRKAAEQALIVELARMNNGEFIAPDRTTFGRYVREFLDGLKTAYARTTWERFDQMARGHVIPKLGDCSVQKLTATQLTKTYAAWREAGLSGQTVLHHHRFIHRVLAQALHENRVRQNVAGRASVPRAPRREMRCLSSEEIDRLYAAVEGSEFALLVDLALACGARRGELVGAKWDDVDFVRGTLAIRRSLEETSLGVAEKTPKSGKSRVVQLPVETVDLLRELRRERGRQASAVPTGYLFPGPDGGAWPPNKVSEGFRRYVKRAGLVGASFHTLRHTCASQLLAQGVHPKVVQEMLGHSTIAITMDLYSHVTPSLQAEAAAKLGAVLSAARMRAQNRQDGGRGDQKVTSAVNAAPAAEGG